MSIRPILYPFTITGFNSALDYLWDEHFVFNGESHDFWEIVCVISGEVEVVADDQVYRLHAGNMICHPPMVFHRIKSSGGTHPHVLVSSFEHIGTLPEKLGVGPFSLNSDEAREYCDVFARMNTFYDKKLPQEEGGEIGCALASFLSRIAATHTPEDKPCNTRRAMEYQCLVGIMKESVCENLSLDGICRRAALGVSTVKSLFAEFSGIAPMTYYANLRAQTALALLGSGSTVAEVSERMNFSSPNYFSHFFQKHFGVIPSKCKK